MAHNPYAPAHESAHELLIERTNMDGVALTCIAYGILSTLFAQCVSHLAPGISRTARKSNARSRPCNARFLLLYSFLIFALATIAIGGNIRYNELTFVDYRNYPGDPNHFAKDFYSSAVSMMSWISYTVLMWLADGLLFYRFFVIYGYRYRLAVLPGIVYLGTIGTSAALIHTMMQPSTSLWSPTAIRIGIISWALSVLLNVTLTLSIVGKLIHARKLFHSSYPASTEQVPYLSISAMIAESAMLYSIFTLFFMIAYGTKQYAMQNIFLPLLGQIAGIASLLIIVRVAQRRAWCRDNSMPVAASAIDFAPEPSSGTSDFPDRRSHSRPRALQEC